MVKSALVGAGLVLSAVIAAACGPPALPGPAATSAPPPAGPSSVAVSSSAPSEAPAASLSGLTLADAASCPVTEPRPAPDNVGNLFGEDAAFGTADLWVGGLGEKGIILADDRFVEADGSIGWKLGWWRFVAGTLTITGRRLDAGAPPLRGVAGDGYGSTGFQASGVYFPTEGCWEVTGTVGDSNLTFITFVLRMS